MKTLLAGMLWMLVTLVLVSCSQVHWWTTNTPLPFHHIYLAINPQNPLYAPLRRLLILRKHALVIDDPTEADLILKLLEDDKQTLPTLINFNGLVTQNTLLYRASIAVLDHQHHLVLPQPINISLHQTHTYSDNQILSHQEEQRFLWGRLYEEAAERCLMILDLTVAHQHGTIN